MLELDALDVIFLIIVLKREIRTHAVENYTAGSRSVKPFLYEMLRCQTWSKIILLYHQCQVKGKVYAWKQYESSVMTLNCNVPFENNDETHDTNWCTKHDFVKYATISE